MSPEFEALLQGWETDIDAVLAMEDHSAHPAYVVAEKMLALADQWEFDRLMQGLGLRPFDAEVLAAHQGSPIQATCRYTQKFISDGEIILTDAWGLMLRDRGDEGFCAPYLCLKGKDDEWRDLSAWLFHVEE